MQCHYDSIADQRVMEQLRREAARAGEPRPHDHLIKREFFTGYRDADMHAEMDARKQQIEQAGGVVTERTRIGRNATCPCGSGRKFKKCCIERAALVGPPRSR